MFKILLIGNFQTSNQRNPTIADEFLKKFSLMGYQVNSTSRKKNKILKLIDMIFVVVTKRNYYDFAIIDVYSGLAFYWAEIVSIILKVINKKFILILHGGNLPKFSIDHPRRVSCLLKRAKMVICPSKYLREKFLDIRKDIIELPNPININCYHFRIRDQLKPNLVWLRAFHRIYNPSLAIEIINTLSNLYPDIELRMVGPDEGDGSLGEAKNLIEKYQLFNSVHLLGRINKENLPLVLDHSDIFINTTNIDNTPVSVIEAMASGLCIVSTNVGGIPFLLDNEIDALLVPPNNPQAMINAINRLINDPGLASSLSLNARRKAEHFDWSNILPLWENIFEHVLEGNE